MGHLDFALPLTFLALLRASLTDRPAVAAALAAGVTVVLAASLPFRVGLVLAVLVGMAVGLWAERR